MPKDVDVEENKSPLVSSNPVSNGEEPDERPRSVTEKPSQSQRRNSVMEKQKKPPPPPPDQRTRTVTEKRWMGVTQSEAAVKLAPAIELSDKDIRIGRAFWKQNIDPQQSAYSMALFRELFLTYPETEFFFLHLRGTGTDTSDIFTSHQFRSHMSDRVVPKLKEILESLDKPEELKDIMAKLGLYHAKLHLRKRHLDDMRKVILASAKRIVGKRMLKEEEVALDGCFAKAFLMAQETIDDYRRLHPERFGR